MLKVLVFKSNPLNYMPVANATMRWLNIFIRTAHIGCVAVLFGGLVFTIPFARLQTWHFLTIVSGMLVLGLEYRQDRKWLHRGKGLLGLTHCGLVALVHFVPQYSPIILWLILISGSIGSHMPRRLRHWSLVDGWEDRPPRYAHTPPTKNQEESP